MFFPPHIVEDGGMYMKKKLQIWGAFFLFLFLFPIIFQAIPAESKAKSTKLVKEAATLVYAANITEEELKKERGQRALLYFTHSHEAYEPVVEARAGTVAVSHQHQTENIMKVGEKLQKQMEFQGVATDLLTYDNITEMSKQGVPYHRAYKAIRSHIESKMKESNYQLIIDLHRDSLGPGKTTLQYNGESYAKVAFVIGMEHPQYEKNKQHALLLKAEMERLVPGITRDIVLKHGAGVDGKYNQDLHPGLLVLELGGVGNTEDELNRTIPIIAEAAAAMLEKINNSKD